MNEVRPAAPAGYAEFLAELKQRIQTAQLRASLGVNRELVLLYWLKRAVSIQGWATIGALFVVFVSL